MDRVRRILSKIPLPFPLVKIYSLVIKYYFREFSAIVIMGLSLKRSKVELRTFNRVSPQQQKDPQGFQIAIIQKPRFLEGSPDFSSTEV